MPRYFFNLRSDEGHQVDIDGLKLRSLNDALEEASFAAQAAIALAEEPTEGCFEIEDEARVLVARVPYAATAPEGDEGEPEAGETPTPEQEH
jgi:hypothetical protein